MWGGQGTVSIVTGVGWLEGDKTGAYKLWLRKPCKEHCFCLVCLMEGVLGCVDLLWESVCSTN